MTVMIASIQPHKVSGTEWKAFGQQKTRHAAGRAQGAQFHPAFHAIPCRYGRLKTNPLGHATGNKKPAMRRVGRSGHTFDHYISTSTISHELAQGPWLNTHRTHFLAP